MATVGHVMENDQYTLEDHSGCSVAKFLRMSIEVGQKQLWAAGEIHMRDNGSLG